MTLLQRLISSTKDLLVFGENTLITNALPLSISNAQHQGPLSDSARKQLVNGDLPADVSKVGPDANVHNLSLQSLFFNICKTYQSSSENEGYQRWGIKHPTPNWQAVEVLSQLLPSSQHLLVFRNPYDVFRSYKARQWLPSLDKLRSLTNQWISNVTTMFSVSENDRMMRVRYEDLVKNGEHEAGRIQEFLKSSAPDLDVLQHKVNTFATNNPGHNPNEYVAPEDLTQQERDLIHEIVGPSLPSFGYQARDPRSPA